MKLSLVERETILLYNQAEPMAEVYTHDPRLMEKLELLANELFAPEGAGAGSAFDSIVAGVDNLQKYCETLVIVSNEIFADGVPYPPETMQYIRILGELHQKLTGKADAVYESVCGILLTVKEGKQP